MSTTLQFTPIRMPNIRPRLKLCPITSPGRAQVLSVPYQPARRPALQPRRVPLPGALPQAAPPEPEGGQRQARDCYQRAYHLKGVVVGHGTARDDAEPLQREDGSDDDDHDSCGDQ